MVFEDGPTYEHLTPKTRIKFYHCLVIHYFLSQKEGTVLRNNNMNLANLIKAKVNTTTRTAFIWESFAD